MIQTTDGAGMEVRGAAESSDAPGPWQTGLGGSSFIAHLYTELSALGFPAGALGDVSLPFCFGSSQSFLHHKTCGKSYFHDTGIISRSKFRGIQVELGENLSHFLYVI